MSTPAPHPSTLRGLVPVVSYSLAGAFVLGILVLALVPSSVRIDQTEGGGSTATVSCVSIVQAGWPRTLTSLDDRITAGGVSDFDGLESVDARAMCESRRDLTLVLMVLLGLAASVAVTVGAQVATRSRPAP